MTSTFWSKASRCWLADQCTIRRAGPGDADTLLRLIDALADYEHLAPPDTAARQRLIGDGFGEKPFFETLLAEVEQQPAGYALYFYTYSTFLAQPTLYLEDIFVLPEQRRHGVGAALMRRLAQEAVENRCSRMEWQVLDWNKPAIDFYERLRARQLREWLPYRLGEAEIERLAGLEGDVR